MSILILICVVLVCLCIAIYAVREIEQLAAFRGLIIAVLCVVAILVIVQKSGLLR